MEESRVKGIVSSSSVRSPFRYEDIGRSWKIASSSQEVPKTGAKETHAPEKFIGNSSTRAILARCWQISVLGEGQTRREAGRKAYGARVKRGRRASKQRGER